MIDAKEIRIGNLYNRKHGKGWSPTIINEEIMGKIFSDSKEYALDDFEPIPLTVEWLDILGFKKGLKESFFKTSPFFKDKNVVHVTRFEGEADRIAVIDSNGIVLIVLQYVHQLQSLHYLISKAEFDI